MVRYERRSSAPPPRRPEGGRMNEEKKEWEDNTRRKERVKERTGEEGAQLGAVSALPAARTIPVSLISSVNLRGHR